MNILILHAITRPNARKTLIDYGLCLPVTHPEHNYWVVSAFDPVTPELKAANFDLCFMSYCFTGTSAAFPETFAFLGEKAYPKIAATQDDYIRSKMRDDWFKRIKVGAIFTPLPDWACKFFPQASSFAQIHHTFCGYIDQLGASKFAKVPSFAERSFDLGTRVRKLTPNLGRFAARKAENALQFADELTKRGVKTNVSAAPEEVKSGDDWLEFLADCRYTFATLSGASIDDPVGDLRRRVHAYMAQNPNKTYDEIADACVRGLESERPFSAISPRLFEAVVTRTGLVLLEAPPGSYEPFKAGIHFLELKEDYSNLDEIIAEMRDPDVYRRLTEACYRDLFQTGACSYHGLASRILDVAKDLGATESEVSDPLPILPGSKSRKPDETAQQTRPSTFSDLPIAIEYLIYTFISETAKSPRQPRPEEAVRNLPDLRSIGITPASLAKAWNIFQSALPERRLLLESYFEHNGRVGRPDALFRSYLEERLPDISNIHF